MTFLITVLVTPLALLTLCFAIEVFVGLKPLRPLSLIDVDQPSAVIVIPAHNEELGLRSSLERLTRNASGGARILVVADNCTDHTAGIARACGVEVIERSDADRRGKGFALDFARTHLRSEPPSVIIIVDADCTIDQGSIKLLIQSCGALRRPCQATNLQKAGFSASPGVQLSTFAFFIKNVIRQRALQRVAARAHLLGTGMAIPWSLFELAELATSNIVEDLKLGQELADAGHAPVFIEQAQIWSNAETDANTISQRRRWEGGFMQNALQRGPPMFAHAARSSNPRLLWAAIDIMIPPFALLITLDLVAIFLASILTWLASAHVWPVLFLCAVLLLGIVALCCAWASGGSRFVSFRSLSRAPLYVAWKLPMYLGIMRRGAPEEWKRTGRE